MRKNVTFFMQPNGKEGLIKHKEQNVTCKNYKKIMYDELGGDASRRIVNMVI